MSRTTTTDILQTKLVIDGKSYTVSLQKATGEIEGFERQTKKSTGVMASAWVDLSAKIYIAKQAVEGLKRGFEFAREGAQVKQLEIAFNRLGGEIEPLRAAVNDTVDDATLMRFSNMANMLGINKEQFAGLAKISKAASETLGIDVKYAIESVSTGTARQSKLWLDNLSILIDVERANSDYARTLDKASSKLTEVEKKQAFINAVLKRGKDLIGKAGDKGSMTDSYDQMISSFENLGDVIKQRLNPYLSKLAEHLAEVNKQWLALLKNTSKITPGSVTVDIPESERFDPNRMYKDQFRSATDADRSSAGLKEITESTARRLFGGGDEADLQARIELQKNLHSALVSERETAATGEIEQMLEFQRQQKELRIQHAVEMVELENEAQSLTTAEIQAANDARLANEQAFHQARFNLARNGIQMLAVAFDKGKEFAIGEAVYNVAAALTKALNTPWPASIGAYAQVFALGTRAIQLAKGARPGGGGGLGGGSVGASNVPVQDQSAPTVKVYIKGGGIEALIEEINTVVEQNDVELISTRSFTAAAVA